MKFPAFHFYWRIVRLSGMMLKGLAVSVTSFARSDAVRRHQIIRDWSRELLEIAGVVVVARGFPPDAERPVTLVANHVSWSDIFALNTQRACHFIAKAELRRWPLAGRLLANVGTIFINRSDRRETHRLGRVVHDLLDAGETVAVFPEGTTSAGRDVLKFHASLLEPVVAQAGEVWVVAIRYFRQLTDGTLVRTDAAAYIGEMNMLESLQAIHAAAPIIADLQFIAAIHCAGKTRREVAQLAEQAIRTVVQSDNRLSG